MARRLSIYTADESSIRCIKYALLWYELFTGELRGMGVKLNLYDKRCAANKMIDGKQCTIAWWVDDNYLTHLSAKVLDRIIESIEAKFGKMMVARGMSIHS